MINSDVLEQDYNNAYSKEENLKQGFNNAQNEDIATVFMYLIDNNRDFVKYAEPYRNDRIDGFLRFIGVKRESINTNNVKKAKLRLSKDLDLFKYIIDIFCFTALSHTGEIEIFQRHIYKSKYDKIAKYYIS